jgi:hypothetical protein
MPHARFSFIFFCRDPSSNVRHLDKKSSNHIFLIILLFIIFLYVLLQFISSQFDFIFHYYYSDYSATFIGFLWHTAMFEKVNGRILSNSAPGSYQMEKEDVSGVQKISSLFERERCKFSQSTWNDRKKFIFVFEPSLSSKSISAIFSFRQGQVRKKNHILIFLRFFLR